jgi:hypothetical protein
MWRREPKHKWFLGRERITMSLSLAGHHRMGNWGASTSLRCPWGHVEHPASRRRRRSSRGRRRGRHRRIAGGNRWWRGADGEVNLNSVEAPPVSSGLAASPTRFASSAASAPQWTDCRRRFHGWWICGLSSVSRRCAGDMVVGRDWEEERAYGQEGGSRLKDWARAKGELALPPIARDLWWNEVPPQRGFHSVTDVWVTTLGRFTMVKRFFLSDPYFIQTISFGWCVTLLNVHDTPVKWPLRLALRHTAPFMGENRKNLVRRSLGAKGCCAKMLERRLSSVLTLFGR